MKVIKDRAFNRSVRTLDKPDQRKALAWVEHLANWDANTRKLIRPNPYVEGIYELNTPDDLRIFFRINREAEEITVVDLSKPSQWEILGKAPAEKSPE